MKTGHLKLNIKPWLLIPAIILAMLSISCKKEIVVQPLSNCNVIEVTDHITAATTWTRGNVYVINRKTIMVRAVLTIDAGVVIKLKDGALEVVEGKVIANGTKENRIIFTSLADDSHCGDSNEDGAATRPEKGDWKGVYLNGEANNSFKYCDFLYAGQNNGGHNNAVKIAGPHAASFVFDNCVFAHTLGASTAFGNSVTFSGGSHITDAQVSILTNNIFYDNDRPIHVDAYYTLDPSNKFHNPSNPKEGNMRNGIFMTNPTNPKGAIVSWNISEIPYVVDFNFTGGGDAAVQTINIGPKTVIKFSGKSAGIAKGPLRIVNLSQSTILTSFKDDTAGGDTNGDGNKSAPAPGDWSGHYDFSTRAFITGANILYASN